MTIDEMLDKLYRASNFLKEGKLICADDPTKRAFYALEFEYTDIKEVLAALRYFIMQDVPGVRIFESDGMLYFRVRNQGRIVENKILVYMYKVDDETRKGDPNKVG